MDRASFDQLFREIASLVSEDPVEGLTADTPIRIGEEVLQVSYSSRQGPSAHLMLFVGAPHEDQRCSVYETLLSLQLLLLGFVDGSFVYDAVGDCLWFAVRVPLTPRTTASMVAQVVRSLVEQVGRWRDEILTGRVAHQVEDIGLSAAQAAAAVAGFGPSRE